MPTLVAQIVPLMLVGNGGTDRLRIQSTYEDIFFNGGDATDSAAVNVDAVSQQAFTPYDVVAHLSVTGTNGNKDQLIQRVDVTGGTFKLGYTPLSGPHAGELEITAAIAWDAPATAVRDALAALPGIGKDSKDEPNVQVDFAPGGYEVHFINDLAHTAQNVFTTKVVVTTTTHGRRLERGTARSPRARHERQLHARLHLPGEAARARARPEPCRRPRGEHLLLRRLRGRRRSTRRCRRMRSSRPSATTAPSSSRGATLPNATSYRVYRGDDAPAARTSATRRPMRASSTSAAAGTCTGPLKTSTLVTAIQTTIPIEWNATADDVQTALEELPSIGVGNVTVTGSNGNFDVEFKGALGHMNIAPMVGNTSSLRSNGVHAIVTLDGGGGSDTYQINLIGGRTDSLINVFDTGSSLDGNDSLVVNGTDNNDVFLLRSATADDGLAFIALINGPTPLLPKNTRSGRAHQLQQRRSSRSSSTAGTATTSSTSTTRAPRSRSTATRATTSSRSASSTSRAARRISPTSRPRTSSPRSTRRRAG